MRADPLQSAGSNGTAAERANHKPRKFSTFMKRLANLKSSAAGPSSSRDATRATGRSASFSSDTPSSKQCLPSGPPSSLLRASSSGRLAFDVHDNYHSMGSTDSITSTSDLDADCDEGQRTAQGSTRSRPAPSTTTVTTSTFSSPTPSMRSLTTTLTTVQSTAPGSMLNANYNPHPAHHHNPNAPPQMYSAPFESQGHSTIVPGLLHPVSYNAATAHGVWTDNASIITLASSSKRRRRRSFDTDASVRALAPSSIFGGSRESLPLSVLSGNFDSGLGGRSVAGERASLRGSTLGGSADAVSVFNGTTGSIMGEISGVGSSLMSPTTIGAGNSTRESLPTGRHSRRNSAWNMDVCDCDEPERRSLSVRSASIKEGEEEDAEVRSIQDGSSNVGVWHGVPGRTEGRIYVPMERDENLKE